MSASPSGPGRAFAAPDQRNLMPPLRPLQHPPVRDSSVIRLRPNPARTSSTTFTRGPVDCLDAPQHYDTVRVRRHGERLPAFRSRRANPAAPPDEAPALVLAAPDVPGIRWRDCVGAATAEQAAENRRASHRGAHSHEIAPSGLTMAPHSPSAIREYSRSTCGRDPVTGRLLFDDERAPARCRARSGG